MTVSVFLPCRKGSERVPKKNVKPFAGIEHGLVALKLEQLLSCEAIDKVVLSTNDEEILVFASGIAHTESYRVCRRLIFLRELAYEQENNIFSRSPRACSSHGFDLRA